MSSSESSSRPFPTQAQYLAPTLALGAAGALLALSMFFPYWQLDLVAVEGSAGLRLVSYLDHLEGPLEQVLAQARKPLDAQLRDLSKLEQSLGVATTTVICLLVAAAAFVRNRWAALLTLPAVVFPLIAIADTYRWLGPIVAGVAESAGEGAARSVLFGRRSFGATVLDLRPGWGLYLAIASALTVVVGLWLHWWSYGRGRGRPVRETGAQPP
jgi:copper chaperone NosL